MSDPNNRSRQGYPYPQQEPSEPYWDPHSQRWVYPPEQGQQQYPQAADPRAQAPQGWPPQDAPTGWPPAAPQDGAGQEPAGYRYPQEPTPNYDYGHGHGQAQPGNYPAASDPYAGYRHPDEPPAVADDPYSQPTLRGRGAPANPAANSPGSGYAPNFEAYSGSGYGQDPVTQPGGYPAPGQDARQEPQLRGATYDDYPHARGAEPDAAAGFDALRPGFDDPSAAAHRGYGQEPADPYAGGYAQAGSDGWPEPAQYDSSAYGTPQGGYGEAGWPSADGQGYPPAGDPGAYGYGATAQAGYGEPHSELALSDSYDDDEEEDEEAGSSRGRWVKIAAAVAGAVVIGAGLAYGYQMFSGAGSKIAAGPPVVRGDSGSAKSRPSNAGGRQFGHSDSQVMDRISKQGRTRADANGDGSRRVSTLTIGANGQVMNQEAPRLPSGSSPSEPVVSVPGLTVVDGFAGQRAAARQPLPPRTGGPITVSPPKTQPKAPAKTSALSPVRPAVVTKKPEAPVRVPQQAPVKKTTPQVKKSPPVRTARKTTSAPTSSGGANGYVAVLASVPVSGSSRLDALKKFADIQQTYSGVLGNRTPDVREADLGARGKYHRLMVGPPASRAAASALCSQLKSAGYPSCWITAY